MIMDNVFLYASRYAMIKDGVVNNIIIVDSAMTAELIRGTTGDDYAINVDQYLVAIGDLYENGTFIHEGNELARQLTLEEENELNKQKIIELQQIIDTMLNRGV